MNRSMRMKPIVKGMLTFVPVVNRFALSGTGGTVSARYCYSVWLRHLVHASQRGLNTNPSVVAELGPGDSLGTGLAALLSGAKCYYGFDVKYYAHSARNLDILDQLVALFEAREPIPAGSEFPLIKPPLESYDFPSHILEPERLDAALERSRVDAIRRRLVELADNVNGETIRYFAPWHEAELIEEGSVDAVISQATMEHVSDLEFTYGTLKRWLRPGAWMSHQIDFKCHHTANQWNGHWTYSDFMWSIIQGKRSYLLNREPHSTHIRLLEQNGFRIVGDFDFHEPSTLRQSDLAPRFQSMSDDDIATSGAFIQAVRP